MAGQVGTQALALAGAFLFAAVTGAIIILPGEDPLFVYSTVWNFSTARPEDFAKVLENATPLIFSGSPWRWLSRRACSTSGSRDSTSWP